MRTNKKKNYYPFIYGKEEERYLTMAPRLGLLGEVLHWQHESAIPQDLDQQSSQLQDAQPKKDCQYSFG